MLKRMAFGNKRSCNWGRKMTVYIQGRGREINNEAALSERCPEVIVLWTDRLRQNDWFWVCYHRALCTIFLGQKNFRWEII